MPAVNETFNPDDEDFETAAMEWHGNITAMAEIFGVVKSTMYTYIQRHPEKMQIIERARMLSDELFLDQAEFVVRYNMNQYKENAGLAQKAAEKVIDKKGHRRGWGENETKDNQPKNDEINDLRHQLMMLRAENEELRNKKD